MFNDASWSPQQADGGGAGVDWNFDETLVFSNAALVESKSQETGGDMGGGALPDAPGETNKARDGGKKNVGVAENRLGR